MKKLLIAVVMLVLLVSSAYADTMDYSGFDDIDLLLRLRADWEAEIAAIDQRIAEIKAEKSDNPEEMGIWELTYYVDEFGRETETPYICNAKLIRGTFSNSVVTDRALSVRFLIDEFKAAIMLYEYGNQKVQNAYSSKSINYYISMLDASEQKHSLTGSMNVNGDRILLDDESAQTLIAALNAGGEIQFVITNGTYTTEKYQFTIGDATCFDHAYHAMIGDLDSIEGYQLTDGGYVVGRDIPSGEYNIESLTSSSILRLFHKNEPGFERYRILKGENIPELTKIHLVNGQRLGISSGRIVFTPLFEVSDQSQTDELIYNFPDGDYSIGIDLPEGKYRVYAIEGYGSVTLKIYKSNSSRPEQPFTFKKEHVYIGDLFEGMTFSVTNGKLVFVKIEE